jgi:hypothetical protein
MIDRHAHRTIPGAVVIITLILLSQRNSLEAFGPCIPLLVSLGLLVTVHTMPRLQTYLQDRNRITLDQYVMATSGPQPAGSSQAVADLTSIPSDEGPHEGLSRGVIQYPLEFAHMHLNGDYRRTTRPDSPEHSSSLDLETGLHPQAQSSRASAETQDPFFSFQGGPLAFRA